MTKTTMSILLASGCAIAQTPAAGVVTERSISLAAAMELATAALERCRADGYKVRDRITSVEGGLPVFGANKELVGSVGVSGAPGGEKDAACAQAGIDKIARSL